jgi:uncharacterized protein
MDITPELGEGRQIIGGYGGGGFRVAGIAHRGSVLVFPERTLPWPVSTVEALGADDFAEIRAAADRIDVLLLGTGAKPATLDAALRADLRAVGIVVEIMDTGAACRTFNVLLTEARQVAAALIAVE